jgi:paired amphipathic helix protein Sin3a
VSELFHGHPQLIEGFNTFLPAGYKIECSKDITQPDMITVTTPTGTILRSTAGGGERNLRSSLALSASPSPRIAELAPPNQALLTPRPPVTPTPQEVPTLKRSDSFEPQFQAQPPINQAIEFVNRIKTRYADDPEVYKRFLDILQGYQKDGTGIESVRLFPF